jgi:riboflavin kinase/FMN adenylyltransferase
VIVVHGTDGVAPGRFRAPVVAIGVFDGVHRGHRQVLARAREIAAPLGGEVVVLTFDVHPRAVTIGVAPPLVTSLPHRLLLLEREGVDATIVLHFDEALRNLSAERFVDEILVARIGVRALVLGYDSHFGKDRRGDFELARRLLAPRGVPVERIEPVRLADGRIVSSSSIRECVARNAVAESEELMGRPPALYGPVVKGDGRGRLLGYPTANLDLAGELRPPRGVYGASVEIGGRAWPAVVNIGGRPTFHPEGDAADTVEVHVIGFTGDLYGQALEVRIFGKLRDEQRFANADELKAQIARDVDAMQERVRRGEWRTG